MIIEETERHLVMASVNLKHAILELKNIPCKCNEDESCWRCDLLDEVRSVRKDINDEISEKFC
ncbi:hypothetical protein [Clostridium pasteurianum]|uniref:hypothetical protein n=1 Tax=Clostridium pasteurianum TaxID=1501 RepID=UPI0003A967C4|nr:hypothetical protein [Clostridium pasteurianum]